DGIGTFDEDIVEAKLRAKAERQDAPLQRKFDEVEARTGQVQVDRLSRKDFVATGIRKAYFRGSNGLTSLAATDEPLTMVLRHGRIVCLSSSCEIQSAVSHGVQVYNLENGYLVPGLTILSPSHGLMDIEGEKSTRDGKVDSKL